MGNNHVMLFGNSLIFDMQEHKSYFLRYIATFINAFINMLKFLTMIRFTKVQNFVQD